jgi:hypothetical protein
VAIKRETKLTDLQKKTLRMMLAYDTLAGKAREYTAVELQQRGIESTVGGVGVIMKGLVKRDLLMITRMATARGHKSTKYKLTNKGQSIAKKLAD